MLRLREYRENAGAALLLALLALLLLSLLGLFLSLSAATGVHISDNYESEVQATYAALAGLRHARVLFRGLALNDLLSGPDGTYDASEPIMLKPGAIGSECHCRFRSSDSGCCRSSLGCCRIMMMV
jgi:Tfp pilus assembly protein PilX